MAFSFDFYPEQHLVRVTFEGEVSVTEEVDALASPAQDPRWFPDAKVLVDRRNAPIRMGPEHVAPQVQHARDAFAHLGRCKVALVVPRDYDFGMARMFEMTSDGVLDHDMKVCRTMEEAAQWLEIDLSKL